MVCFLLSPAASYLTSTTVRVDGGRSLYQLHYIASGIDTRQCVCTCTNWICLYMWLMYMCCVLYYFRLCNCHYSCKFPCNACHHNYSQCKSDTFFYVCSTDPPELILTCLKSLYATNLSQKLKIIMAITNLSHTILPLSASYLACYF